MVRNRGFMLMVVGALMALGVSGNAWRVYHLIRVFMP